VSDLTRPGITGIALDSSLRRYEQALAVADLADRERIDLVTAPDHPYLPRELEVWTFLTTVAARTERVAVGTNVASVALRPAPMLAKAAATLQVVSNGRVALGVGAGGPLDQVNTFLPDELTTAESVTALEEALNLLRATGQPGPDPLRIEGVHHRIEGARFGPQPDRPVPLWVGSFAPRTLRLTGQYADGWLPTNLYLELSDVPGMQARIDRAAHRAGRDPARIRRVFNVMGTISDDAERENGRRLVGPPGHWAEALTEYHERLGFDGFVFWSISGDPLEQAQRFVEEVRPELPKLFQSPV
jgi:alkanesulfonate monooxygenase SsuD/methylene tetrahydromethanopterin reductase-like flavin-dependent oxidoreductase (luciferase family)